MTPFLRPIGAPFGAALATAVIFTTLLWVQHTRLSWPFNTARAAAVDAARTSPGGEPHDVAAHRRTTVDAAATRNLDITLETVGRDTLRQTVRAVATIVPDESRIAHVHTRVSGWVEHLEVSTTGEVVRAGQALMHLFSQELLSSQIEYLAARHAASASGITTAVLASGRTRLGVLGMTAAEIDAIEQSGEPRRLITVVAPRNGVVVNRGVTAGTSVDPSTTLLTIADLSRVWVLAEIPETGIPIVRVGTPAQLTFAASRHPPFAAKVEFVYPTLTERTRTLRVRLSVANPGGALRPGLYGTAAFASEMPNVITIPRDAVVDTGLQQHVFVAVGDRFEPRVVVLGAQLADRVEVRAGVGEGERIVASGVFLLDSESRLRATGGNGHQHGPPSPREKPSKASPATDPHAGHRG